MECEFDPAKGFCFSTGCPLPCDQNAFVAQSHRSFNMECEFDPEQGACFSKTCPHRCVRNIYDAEHSDIPISLPPKEKKLPGQDSKNNKG
jgi:hypothetical protein